ncbi:MAG: hypothetical protein ACRCX5_14445 [Bacteroidales bacterium]
MKYNIFEFDQAKVLSLKKTTIDSNNKEKVLSLDVSDLLILHVMSDFMNRSKIIKYTVDDKTFFSVQYKVIMEDLPILNIKQQALSDRLNKMAEIGVIEKMVIRNQAGSYTAFRMTSMYEYLKYGRSSELQVQECSTTSAEVVNYIPKDSSTNNSSSNTKEKKDTIVSKEKKFSFLNSLLELGIEENIAKDFMLVRKNKKATNSETAFDAIKREIEKTNATPNECIKLCVERDWKGFKAEWYERIQPSMFDDNYINNRVADMQKSIDEKLSNRQTVKHNGKEYR